MEYINTVALLIGWAVMIGGGLVLTVGLWWVVVEFAFKRLGWTARVARWAIEESMKKRQRASQ